MEKKNGKAKEYLFWNCKLHFEGEYFNGKRWNGKEYDTVDNNIIYEIRNGKGFLKEYSMLGPLFEGEYVSGERNGKGKEYDRGTLMYEGEFLNGKKSGKGKEYDNNGKVIFEGEYLYGYRRKGKEYMNGILEFEGEYMFKAKWSGKGYDKEGKVIMN